MEHWRGRARSVVHVETITRQNHWGRAGLMGVMALMLAAPGAQAAGRWATLEAIHCLENPRNLTRPGAKGELGAYQFRAATWRMHTTVPFVRALDRGESDTVAVLHYEWLRRGLEHAGVEATPYTIALAWNGGLKAAVSGRAPGPTPDRSRPPVRLPATSIS